MFVSKFFRHVTFFSVAAVLITSVASAQDGGGGRPRGEDGGRGRGQFGGGQFGGGRMGGPGGFTMRVDRARLLGIEKVRQELKIEEAQAATIDAALEAYREQRDASGSGFNRDEFEKMSEEDRTAAFEKMQKQREELSKQTDEVLNALLEEGQKTRLDQIGVQVRMAMGAIGALKADDMKEKLTLTEEQITKLTEAETTINDERQKAMEEIRGDFSKMGEVMTTLQKKSTEMAMAVLTDDQKKQVAEMTGPEFKVELRDMMGRGPGGGGGPGGGRGPGGGGPGGGRGRGGDRPKSE